MDTSEEDPDRMPPMPPPLKRIRSTPLLTYELVDEFKEAIRAHTSIWDMRTSGNSILNDPDTVCAISIAEKVLTHLPHYLGSTEVTTRAYKSSTSEKAMQTEAELYVSKKMKISVCYLEKDMRTVTRKTNATEIFVCVFGDLAVKGVREHSSATPGHYECSYDETTRALSDIKEWPIGLTVGEKINLTRQKPVVIAHNGFFTFKAETDSLYLKIEQITDRPILYAWKGTSTEPEEVKGVPLLRVGEQRSDESARVVAMFTKLVNDYNHKSSSITNLDMSLLLSALKDSFYFRCQKLSATMKASDHPCLRPKHSEMIRNIRDALCLWILRGGSVTPSTTEEWDRFKPRLILNCENGEFIEVMKRMILYDDDSLQIRAHLFPDGAETFIHNHSGNFFSVCLQGQYRHHTWVCDNSKTDYSYTRRQRTTGGGLTPQKEAEHCIGQVHKVESFVHDTLNTYFLHSGSFHTVETPRKMAGERSYGVLTLFIRDKCKSGKTFVLTPTDKISADLGDSKEEAIADNELTQFISDVDQHIKDAGYLLRPVEYLEEDKVKRFRDK